MIKNEEDLVNKELILKGSVLLLCTSECVEELNKMRVSALEYIEEIYKYKYNELRQKK